MSLVNNTIDFHEVEPGVRAPSTLQMALKYAANDYPVFPLRGKTPWEQAGKPDVDGLVIPPGKGGFHTATTNQAKIERWAAAYPGCNWGIPTGQRSGFDVLDLDGDEGLAWLESYEKGHRPLPLTPRQRTGSGGLHVLFASGHGLRCSAGQIASGVDIRSDGGYIVVAPSIHPETNEPYAWEVRLGDVPLAPWPAKLHARIQEANARRTAEPGARIPLGVQENTLISIAGSMRAHGTTEAEILAAIARVSEDRCDPPVLPHDLERMAHSIAGYPFDDALPASDVGNAKRLYRLYEGQFKWVPEIGKGGAFTFWNGQRWEEDTSGIMRRRAHGISELVKLELAALPVPQAPAAGDLGYEAKQAEYERVASLRADLRRWIRTCEHSPRIDAMLKEVRYLEGVTRSIEDFDLNPNIINLANGTLDLITFELRAHNPDDYITRMVPFPYKPDAGAPRWRQFLEEVFPNSPTTHTYIQRRAGYGLTGNTNEREAAICVGRGRNGKTTMLNVFLAILGDYGATTPMDTFDAHRHSQYGDDLARLRGKRLVVAGESEQDRQLASARLKQMTGQDALACRFLYGQLFSFRPQFKVWLATNHKLAVRDTSDGMWDRLKLLQFDQRFEGDAEDRTLETRLLAEAPGILAWMVEGCRQWRADGLGEPEAITNATQQYREENDPLAAWIAERCLTQSELDEWQQREDEHKAGFISDEDYKAWREDAKLPGNLADTPLRTKVSELYKDYEDWAPKRSAMGLKSFSQELGDQGFEFKKRSDGNYRLGIGLLEHGAFGRK